MNQNSEVAFEQKSIYDSEFILIDSEASCKSSYSKLSEEIVSSNNHPPQNPLEDSPSINYTINSPLSIKSLEKNPLKTAKILKKKPGKKIVWKTSLSLAESYQDPVIDSRIFNIVDLSAIEGKSNFKSNSPDNTNVNNSFMTNDHDFGIFMIDGPLQVYDKEEAIANLKEVLFTFLKKCKNFLKQNQKLHGILMDNINIILNVLKTCSEKIEPQKCMIRYVMFLLKENLSKNEEFTNILPKTEVEFVKEKCEIVKGLEFGACFGNYGIKLDLDLLRSSFREEAISFLFRVKNFEEKQNLMNVLMNTSSSE